jgi:hypothetical protein
MPPSRRVGYGIVVADVPPAPPPTPTPTPTGLPVPSSGAMSGGSPGPTAGLLGAAAGLLLLGALAVSGRRRATDV